MDENLVKGRYKLCDEMGLVLTDDKTQLFGFDLFIDVDDLKNPDDYVFQDKVKGWSEHILQWELEQKTQEERINRLAKDKIILIKAVNNFNDLYLLGDPENQLKNQESIDFIEIFKDEINRVCADSLNKIQVL